MVATLSSRSKGTSGIDKFCGEDFAAWKLSMKMALMGKGLWSVTDKGVDYAAAEIVDETIVKPDEAKDDEYQTRLMKVAKSKALKMDQKAQAEITLSLEVGYQAVARGKNSAQEIWRALCATFEKDNVHRNFTSNRC